MSSIMSRLMDEASEDFGTAPLLTFVQYDPDPTLKQHRRLDGISELKRQDEQEVKHQTLV